MIPDADIERMRATANRLGDSELGRHLHRLLDEHALLRDEHHAFGRGGITSASNRHREVWDAVEAFK